jgi:hypothetical protein
VVKELEQAINDDNVDVMCRQEARQLRNDIADKSNIAVAKVLHLQLAERKRLRKKKKERRRKREREKEIPL